MVHLELALGCKRYLQKGFNPACGVVPPCCGFPILALLQLHGGEAARGPYILIAILFSTYAGVRGLSRAVKRKRLLPAMSVSEHRAFGFPPGPQLLLSSLTAPRLVLQGGLHLFPFPARSVSRLEGTSAEITLQRDWDRGFAQNLSMSSAELS